MSEEYEPKWFSPPGESIAVFLEEAKSSLEEFAAHMNVDKDAALKILEGLCSIDDEKADALAGLVGGSKRFWLERERQYRSDYDRVKGALELSDTEFLDQFPLTDLYEIGLQKHKFNQSRELMDFLGFESAALCQQNLKRALRDVVFRESKAFKHVDGATYAWLRRCELSAYKVNCTPLDMEGFKETLQEVRGLTKIKDPAVFVPELRRLCATRGVVVVVERAPKGCTVSGATKYQKGNRAMIALTFRHLSDDQFWFTFFHEAGHLVLHDRAKVFLESEGIKKTVLEAEADEFAAETLIPRKFLEELHQLKSRSKEIIRFAVKVGIAPGIVVGQLQHIGMLGYKQLNGLKRRYRWVP